MYLYISIFIYLFLLILCAFSHHAFCSHLSPYPLALASSLATTPPPKQNQI